MRCCFKSQQRLIKALYIQLPVSHNCEKNCMQYTMFGSLGRLGLHGESGLVSKHRSEGCLASRLIVASRRLLRLAFVCRGGLRTLSFASVGFGMEKFPTISRTCNLPAEPWMLGKHSMMPLAKSMHGPCWNESFNI